MISRELAGQLLDMGARIGRGVRADEQLEGSVALHNILERHDVAYLADEVGMGKTYVALGVVALMRHFNPGMRLLVVAPRANIQRKWIKEMSNFVAHNVRYPDLRTRSFGGRPTRPMVYCENLAGLARAVTVDPDRDFFARLSSFSLPLGKSSDGWKEHRDRLRVELPWLPSDVFDLRDRATFKRNFAHALCCAIPKFDLVIIDEAHNLKHGIHKGVAARNQVLAGALGYDLALADSRLRRHLGPRAGKLLLLSATPVEETYTHLWNQLAVFGRGAAFPELRDSDMHEDQRKAAARKFLIRRVTQMSAGGEKLTKNLYRREWRGGGVERHDEQITITDDRQRLVVALVQKKVSELLGSEKFSPSFQIGMLASFESFLQTAKLTASDDSAGNFDDAEQTDAVAEREGVDVGTLNRLARDYRLEFNEELPHPKMDAVVQSLERSWRTGEKALVFVRRVASVPELKRKLDVAYDRWLIGKLVHELPKTVRSKLVECIREYHKKRKEAFEKDRRQIDAIDRDGKPAQTSRTEADTGGLDTFFAWFFRGEGPGKVASGANIQRRFIQKGTALSTFFMDNPVMTMLGAPPGSVLSSLAVYLGRDVDAVRDEISKGAKDFLSGGTKKHQGSDRFAAAMSASLVILQEHEGVHQLLARALYASKYAANRETKPTNQQPDVVDWLEHPTFFSELARPERAELRAALWPDPDGTTNEAVRVREQEVRALLLSMASRLGHAFVDLYVLLMQRLKSMGQGATEAEGEAAQLDADRVHAYLDMLERQRTTPLNQRDWGAFDELAEISAHFGLLVDLNLPEANSHDTPLSELPKKLSDMLQAQQPVAGMWGSVSPRLVRQFRMPGYPMVLFTTDVLQEGEDLHTFCSTVQHYGISWTPSSMEQRVGRVDRVRSQTDRRFEALGRMPTGDEKLQVHYPYLPDTVELLQVRRVLERTDMFLRLMHEGFPTGMNDSKRIEIASELRRHTAPPEPYGGKLETAFPVPEWALKGSVKALMVGDELAKQMEARFEALAITELPGLRIEWEASYRDGRLLGTVGLASGRVQPFLLLLKSIGERPLVRCISPVGRVAAVDLDGKIATDAREHGLRLGAIENEDASYNLTVEQDVLLAAPQFDAGRVAVMLERLVRAADELELRHLDETDQPLTQFEADMRNEGGRGDA